MGKFTVIIAIVSLSLACNSDQHHLKAKIGAQDELSPTEVKTEMDKEIALDAEGAGDTEQTTENIDAELSGDQDLNAGGKKTAKKDVAQPDADEAKFDGAKEARDAVEDDAGSETLPKVHISRGHPNHHEVIHP